ncbi:Utp20p [Sporobolomyces salmoneus]|uniref:Utp20p n=1 Tax=Sporobolomyces salmoneus TaxID=183962 RepID=UPI0031811E25
MVNSRKTKSSNSHGSSTLRSLRHNASSSSSSKPSKDPKKLRSTSTLSVKEQIAKRASKPVIKGRQFKWISPAARIGKMKVDLDAVRDRRDMLEGEEEGREDEMHSLFGHALHQSLLINLSIPFNRFNRKIEKSTRSLPLVVHFRKEIVEAICEVLAGPSHEVELCGETILDLLPPLVTDLAHLLLPHLTLLLTTLIRLTAPSPLHSANPHILQRVYDVLGALFRDLGRDILAAQSKEDPEEQQGGLSDVWEVVRRGLGAPARPEEEDVIAEEISMEIEGATAGEKDGEASDEEEEETEILAPVASTSAQPFIDSEPRVTLHRTLPRNFRTTPQTRRLLGNSFSYLVRKAKPTSLPDSPSELSLFFDFAIQDVAEVVEIDGGERPRGRGAKGRGKGKGKGRGQEEGNSNIFAEGVTWVVVESCTAPNNLFHSRTPSILRTLINAVLSLPSPATLPSDISAHAIISLTSHVYKTEPLEPVADVLLKVLADELKSQGDKAEKDWERLCVALKVVSCLIGVRNGSRTPPSLKPKLFALLALLTPLLHAKPTAAFLHHLLTFLTSLLPQAVLSDILSSPVRTILEAFFAPQASDSVFAAGCTLASVLDQSGWNLFETSLAKLILESTGRNLASESEKTNMEEEEGEFGQVDKRKNSLALLGKLTKSERLRKLVQKGGQAAAVWEKNVVEVAQKVIKSWKTAYEQDQEVEEEQTFELLDVLLIAPYLNSSHRILSPLLASLASTVSSSPVMTARTAYLSSASSPAVVLGTALSSYSAIADLTPPEASINQKLADQVQPMILNFSWHRQVMRGVASLNLARLASDRSDAAKTAIYDSILPNLLSEDALLRLSSLEIAATLFPPEETPVAADLVAKCIEAEQMPLSVQGAREKSMKLRKLGLVANGQLGRDGEDEKPALDIVVRYLTAMLKVNFKPLWPEATGALALLSGRFADTVWNVTHRQLLAAATRGSDLFVARKPEWAESLGGSSTDLPLVFEEQQLREFHFEDLRNLVAKEERMFDGGIEAVEAREESLITAQIAPERLVIATYESNLLSLFCAIPEITQRHSRDYVQVFLGSFQRDDVIPDKADDAPQYFHSDESAKERKSRLVSWLGLFSKLHNPKALYRAAELDALFRTFLAFPDIEIQKLALECILRWKIPAVAANSERLKNLLDQTKLRDELLQFVSTTADGGLEPSHRADVVPLIIRITYGLMTSRLGRASASSGQGRAGRRAAILGALRTCSPEELGTLVDLTLGPLRKLLVTQPGEPFRFAPVAPSVPGKRQLGFLGLLADILKHLGKDLVSRWPDLLGATLNLLHFAQKGLEGDANPEAVVTEEGAEDEEEEDKEEEDGEGEGEGTRLAPLRHIRQTALKRLAVFFRLEVDFDFRPYLAAAFPSFISPRLPTLAAENAQAPSALLELFVTWAVRRDLLRNLVDFDPSLLPSLYGVLTVRNVKPAVILRVFDIVSHLVEFSAEDGGKDSEIGREVVQPSVDVLLVQLGGLIAVTSSSLDAKGEVAQRQISLLCALAEYVNSQEQATNFISLVTPLLRKTNKTVPEKVKTDLLKILTALYPLARPEPNTPLYDRCVEVISTLFSSARARNARLQLVAAFNSIASIEPSFQKIATVIEDLNSYSAKRSEEPDFDRRLAAFSLLNEQLYSTLRPAEWIVVIYNMLFFVQDEEELAIRSNASYALRRFVEVSGTSDNEGLRTALSKIYLPGLRNCLRSKVELIRSEVLAVIGYSVEKVQGIAELDQMKPLLVEGDIEANWFNNILHIQNHRRTRALRRLADEVEAGHLSSKVIADFFLPLLDHFIIGSDEKKDPDLVNETVQCLGRLAKYLAWSAYSKLTHHYLKLARAAGAAQKPCVRALVSVLKGFHFNLETEAHQLATTSNRLVPNLLSYLEQRDDSNTEIRVPVAEGINAVIQHIPGDTKDVQETALLMSLSQLLRSRDQHVRDLVRLTLANIVVANEKDTLSRAVKELRKALARGPQLHVLAFKVHALLVRLAESPDNVDFDEALQQTVPVLEGDIFGAPSKDRHSQEFRAKTKFREVRSFKSLDSFQILAKVVTPNRISSLLAPLREQMHQTDSAKTMRDVEEVFKALSLGLVANPKLDPTATLDLCHSLITQNANFVKNVKTVRKGKKAAPDFHVQMTRDSNDVQDTYSKNAYRFVSFGLELFNSAFRKSQFDLDSPEIISRLEPLLSLVGNSLYSEDPVVLARSMRATASLIRCPLTSRDKAAPVLVKQMMNVVERSGSTESELAQSALRTLSTVIRDCKTVVLKEQQLTTLLELIAPDIEEADRQATLFQLLRAIMSRKFVAPEIYDLMDKVAEMLVTNQSTNVRDVCRSIYLQFLLDYPQGRGRLKTSLTFLVKNLSYQYDSGRLSVLELLSAILGKFATQLIQESADLFFVGLVMVIANDESTRCREMAAELVKILFNRIDTETRATLVSMLHSWAGKKGQPQLARTAVQLFGVAVDALGEEGKNSAPAVVDVLLDILTDSEEKLEQAEQEGEDTLDLENDWQLPYQALQSLSHVYKAFPDLVSPDERSNHSIWKAVRGHLLYPHIWIRASSARLLGNLYAASSSALPSTDLPELHPLATPNLLDAAQKGCLQFKSPLLNESLAMQIVKNLFFAAKCFDARSDTTHFSNEEDQVAEEEEVAGGAEADEKRKSDPLRWLLTRLSYQTRQAHTARPSMHDLNAGQWSLQPASILRFFAACISHLDKESLQRFTMQLAIPIFRISEDPNAQDPQMAELQTLAREVQELMQSKIGTTEYAAVHNEIRKRAAEKRNERKRTLALQAINDPEEDAKRKSRRAEQKKNQKKRKVAAFADKKERFGDGSKRRRGGE